MIVVLEISGIKRLALNKRNFTLSMAFLIFCYGLTSFIYSHKYKDKYAFWESAVVTSPHSPLAHRNLGAMYHLDGKDLMLTHYCAIGNQPSMRLDRNGSTPSSLKFDFAGGTNLDPEVDHHIHNSKILFTENGGLQSLWTSYAQGKQAAVMKFTLFRAQD